MPKTNPRCIRFDPHVNEQIEAHARRNGLTFSAAVTTLVCTGLEFADIDAKESDDSAVLKVRIKELASRLAAMRTDRNQWRQVAQDASQALTRVTAHLP